MSQVSEPSVQRRDAAVEGIESKLARRLKRALQDEQNEVLDRLRSSRAGAGATDVLPSPADQAHLHLGLYAYRRDDLLRYAEAPPSPLELLEGLEQLRFLDQGQVVKILPLDLLGWDCIELNNPSDVALIEAVLRQRGID